MTLKECYAAMEGNYEDVLSRLMTERLVQKFVLKFLDDKSFDMLCRAMEEQNAEEAFRAAHTIKGVCQNLSMTKLYGSSVRITEALRGGDMAAAAEILPQLRADYEQTASELKTFQAEN